VLSGRREAGWDATALTFASVVRRGVKMSTKAHGKNTLSRARLHPSRYFRFNESEQPVDFGCQIFSTLQSCPEDRATQRRLKAGFI